MIEKALRYLLSRDTQVNNLVRGRISPQKVPQRSTPGNAETDPGSFPRITYQRVGTRRVKSQDGETGLANATVKIVCWGRTFEEAFNLAEAVRQAKDPGTSMRLDGWKYAQMGPAFVQSVWLTDDSDDMELPAFADEGGVQSISIMAECWFDEPTRGS